MMASSFVTGGYMNAQAPDDKAEVQSDSLIAAQQLELPNANVLVDDEFTHIWGTAEIIGALSSDDYRWSFTSILLALLYSEQDMSQWFLSYATSANIRLAEISGRRGFHPEQLPKIRAEFAQGGSFLKKSAFTSSTLSLFQGATDLYAPSAREAAGPMGARHLLGAYIYRLPSGHADQLREWGFVPADWSTNFLLYLSSRVPRESFWAGLHAEHFGASAPRQGVAEPSLTEEPKAFVRFDINAYSLSFAAQQILNDASARAAACDEPISTSRVLLEMTEHGRPGRDPQWAGAFLRQAVEEQGKAYEEKIKKYRSEGQDRELQNNAQDAQPPQASIMTRGLASSLKRAAEIATQTSGEPVIKGRHLLAALILEPTQPSTPTAPRQLEEMGIDLPLFRESLYNWVRGYGDNDSFWRAVLVGTVAEPRRRAAFDADNATGPDFLQIEQDVLALATLIAARDSSPPLSIGLFGDWGSGKTFFMGQLRRTIAQLADEANNSKKMQRELPFYKRIVQIEFNAWHYVEGNLWASMVEHILDNLRVSEKQTPTATEQLQQYWINKLGFAEKAKIEADRKASEASSKVSKAEGEVRAAASQLETKKSELQQLSRKSVARDFKLSGALPLISESLEPLGLKPLSDSVMDLQSSLLQAWTVLERGNATLVPLVHAKDKKDRWRSLLIILLGAPLVGALIGWVLLQLGKPGIAEISAFATGVAGLLSGVAAWLRKQALWISQQIEKVREAQTTYDKELADALAQAAAETARTEQELASARQDYALAQQRADQARREEDAARSDLAAATTSRLLGQFIQDRAASSDYRKHLGVLAIVRQDFQELSRLIEEDNWRLAPEGVDDLRFAGRLTKVKSLEEEGIDLSTRINRIVLYIDDLDRCPPTKVVDVLQAVHLLLAFPLFVVVVGVDARWISRSLEARYRELLHVGNAEAAVDLTQMFGVARSEDYLEKIFQIPLWLRAMDAGAARRMVQGLLRPGTSATPASNSSDGMVVAGRNNPVPEPGENVKQSVLRENDQPKTGLSETDALSGMHVAQTVISSSQASEPGPVVPNLDSLRVADFELSMIDELSPLLGRSPRALKRFVNLYRLIKARLTPTEHNAFTRRSDKLLADYEAVLFLLAVDTGLPRVSRLVFDELIAISREPGALEVDMAQFVKRLDQHSGAEISDWYTLKAWITDHSGIERFNRGIMRIAEWVEQVSRYSFQAAHLEARSGVFNRQGLSSGSQ
jgi:KAP family P-loop domain